jgi:hypothetical protein
MRAARGIVDRLYCERGYSLMELMVSVTVGIVIVLAGHKLLASTSRASAEIVDRADAAHRARDGMEAITSRLRSQVCLNDDGPAIVRSSPTSMDFFSVYGSEVPAPVIYGNEDSDDDVVQARRIEFRGGVNGAAGKIMEYVWESPLPSDDDEGDTRVPGAASVFPALGADGLTPATFTTPPDQVRTLMTGVETLPGTDGVTPTIFKYFRFQAGSPATPNLEVPASTYLEDDPNSSDDGDNLARVVRIEVAFEVVAERVTGPGPDDRKKVLRRDGEARGTDSIFTNEAYVRTADSGQPEESPECF